LIATLHEDDDIDWWLASYIQVQEATVAVKMLYSSEPRNFEAERGILEELGSKGQHPHLISLLCTFKWGDKYHLVFPWAEGNLCEYWEQETMPEFTEQIVHWSLRQMAGLASGLSEIHNFRVPSHDAPNGLHGDIKPKNILYFKQRPNYEDPTGVLQIAGFGQARLYRVDDRVHACNVTPSPTYSPPDHLIGDFVSRKYDMWSLGCVYLEFVTWLILGCKAIHDFADCCGNTCQSVEIYDDYFYTKTEDTAVVRQGVIEWVHKLKRQERCSQALLDLLELIMSKLIVIEPRKRISSQQLYGELSVIVDRAGQDTTYLLSKANGDIDDLPNPQSILNNVPINAIRPEISAVSHSSTWPLNKTSG
jgi:serine/threonine protein kinase